MTLLRGLQEMLVRFASLTAASTEVLSPERAPMFNSCSQKPALSSAHNEEGAPFHRFEGNGTYLHSNPLQQRVLLHLCNIPNCQADLKDNTALNHWFHGCPKDAREFSLAVMGERGWNVHVVASEHFVFVETPHRELRSPGTSVTRMAALVCQVILSAIVKS